MAFNYSRIVIKIGSNVFTQNDGLPDLKRIGHLVDQMATIKKQVKKSYWFPPEQLLPAEA